jgi:hypothetical protein
MDVEHDRNYIAAIGRTKEAAQSEDALVQPARLDNEPIPESWEGVQGMYERIQAPAQGEADGQADDGRE